MTQPDSTPSEAVRLEAAEWFARSQSGAMGPEALEALNAWLQADEAHRRAFDDMTALWDAIEPVRRDPRLMGARERARRAMRRRALLRLAAPIGAIAAAIVVAIGLQRVSPAAPVEYDTRIGQTSAVRLADGSRVVLDTDSAVRVWPRGFRERRVELTRGRAHFEVAKNPDKPFVVRTGQGSVTALGTVFDVRLQPTGMKVVLVEGRVRVQPPAGEGRAVLLKAGDQVEADGVAWRTSRADTDVETSWLRGELVFSEAPLSVVVAELNRYSGEKIRIADPAVGERRLSAVLRTGDSAMFASSVQRLKLAKVRRESRDLLVIEQP